MIDVEIVFKDIYSPSVYASIENESDLYEEFDMIGIAEVSGFKYLINKGDIKYIKIGREIDEIYH